MFDSLTSLFDFRESTFSSERQHQGPDAQYGCPSPMSAEGVANIYNEVIFIVNSYNFIFKKPCLNVLRRGFCCFLPPLATYRSF